MMLVRVGLNVVKRRRNILPALTVSVADELGPEKAETTVTFLFTSPLKRASQMSQSSVLILSISIAFDTSNNSSFLLVMERALLHPPLSDASKQQI